LPRVRESTQRKHLPKYEIKKMNAILQKTTQFPQSTAVQQCGRPLLKPALSAGLIEAAYGLKSMGITHEPDVADVQHVARSSSDNMEILLVVRNFLLGCGSVVQAAQVLEETIALIGGPLHKDTPHEEIQLGLTYQAADFLFASANQGFAS
jgi:hypothetical protein